MGGCGSYFTNLPSFWSSVITASKSFAGCNHSYHYDYPNGPAVGGPLGDCGGGAPTSGTR
ncbi:hypothetical protein DB31_5781 [Hyalangium minutum]|uniref:Uncharacterized protein n=1 Tax=Hyalangium minutum TaxID=394096 RepID=A0A085WSS6_9BACT|nr:hypothetical protein DB31_5781 [Hyalangium minutum]